MGGRARLDRLSICSVGDVSIGNARCWGRKEGNESGLPRVDASPAGGGSIRFRGSMGDAVDEELRREYCPVFGAGNPYLPAAVSNNALLRLS